MKSAVLGAFIALFASQTQNQTHSCSDSSVINPVQG